MNSHNLLPLIGYIFVKFTFWKKNIVCTAWMGQSSWFFQCYIVNAIIVFLIIQMPFINSLFFFLHFPPNLFISCHRASIFELDLVILVYHSLALIISLMLCMSVLIIIDMRIIMLQNFQRKKKN